MAKMQVGLEGLFDSCPYLIQLSPLDPKNTNLNCTGIIYEYNKFFFVAIEEQLSRGHGRRLLFGFLALDAVGPYLMHEWFSLDKEEIDDIGISACKMTGRWTHYSRIIQEMRVQGFSAAMEVQEAKEKIEEKGNLLNQDKARAMLDVSLGNAVMKVYKLWRREERAAGIEGQKFMDEFMVFDD
ncbi:uncharacterized protein SETTUDRAFT_37609 [Exserohilum turcica Et28A]|uniref:Uncharacterized protein n=1 Tax=Exserohilum turcicum (strain 28A) TaxID=671987 RepID=R0KQ35_EXST2|nr:uncharacterized protein SETTUDRAFT_37609 [Exserohilum turcica Et28A]EOA89967.1 hypothetical protein SETTUDRAFT_37609 [Exserohilum turcica Et28A]